VERQPTGSAAGALAGVALVAVLAVVAAGIGYEQAGRVRDRDRLPRIGRAVDIGGRTLNIECAGAGSPTVILADDGTFPGYSWLLVQRRIARFARVCWYDDAGFGWSDPAPGPRDSAAIARDLHALLKGADVRPPYVLVGTGTAGFHARVFTGRYPEEVAAMVLGDAVQEDEGRRMPWSKGPVPEFLKPVRSFMAQVAGEIGVTRLAARQDRPAFPQPEGLSDREWATIAALRRQSKVFPARAKELAAFVGDGEEARAAGGLGGRPLIVLASQRSGESPEHERIYRELQEQLARLSSRGKLVWLNAEFPLQYTAPDAIALAVREVARR
jgi:pimeloyl-ACP methyl ester carboxylesterase